MPKIQISNARLSFPDLFDPTQVNGEGTPSYRAQFLIGNDTRARVGDAGPDGKTVWGDWGPGKTVLDNAIAETAKAKWGVKAQAIMAANEGIPQKHCFIDGKKRPYDGYAGKWALSTSRPEKNGRPLVVDADKTPLVARDGRPYAGCYVTATVSFWPQDNKHGKAVRCELQGVQFLRDGEAFSGGGAASEDDFDDVTEGATADDLT